MNRRIGRGRGRRPVVAPPETTSGDSGLGATNIVSSGVSNNARQNSAPIVENNENQFANVEGNFTVSKCLNCNH